MDSVEMKSVGPGVFQLSYPRVPKAKKPAKPKSKAKKLKKKTVKSKTKRKAESGAVVRTERLDMRLSKAEKAKITAKAKKTGLSITKVVYAAIAKL